LGRPVSESVRAIISRLTASFSRWRTSSLIVNPAIPAIVIQSSAAPGSVTG
jgi:hypothetical protein